MDAGAASGPRWSARADLAATTRRDIYSRRDSRIVLSQPATVEVQIFGLKKSADTRKALRFFAERRIRTHFVDLQERELAAGELQRFADRFGLDALVDRESARFAELGMRHAQIASSRWAEKLIAEPALLKLPLVRRLGQPPALTIGLATDAWKLWLK